MELHTLPLAARSYALLNDITNVKDSMHVLLESCVVVVLILGPTWTQCTYHVSFKLFCPLQVGGPLKYEWIPWAN